MTVDRRYYKEPPDLERRSWLRDKPLFWPLLFLAIVLCFRVIPALAAKPTAIDPGKPTHGASSRVAYTCWQPQEALQHFCVFYIR